MDIILIIFLIKCLELFFLIRKKRVRPAMGRWISLITKLLSWLIINIRRQFHHYHHLRHILNIIMTINSEIKRVLSVIGLQDVSKDAIAQALPKCEEPENLFTDLADTKSKVEATFRLIVDTIIVLYIDIRCVMFIFDWFLANIVDPFFAWDSFTHLVYVADKRARAVAKATKITTAAQNTTTAPAISTINFSTDVLISDANRQATPVTPRTTATLIPHLSWKSPFAASSRNSYNIHQLHNTEIVLASSEAPDVLEFYRNLVALAKPSEIDS
jgi:hypothetical protein